MKIYVAGKNLERAGRVVKLLRDAGHTITFDWATDYSDKDPVDKARKERDGVVEADLVVYLWENDQESAHYEAGMAMGLKKPMIVSGKSDAFFFTLPEITCISSDNEILTEIEKSPSSL